MFYAQSVWQAKQTLIVTFRAFKIVKFIAKFYSFH